MTFYNRFDFSNTYSAALGRFGIVADSVLRGRLPSRCGDYVIAQHETCIYPKN